ncbi:MAG TPA: nickel-dependent lactate racemase [Candidatus Acidoferrum sp.]|nr:nickel-dependent lactate racemase [Candidatus Acidoferrum sp.]
MHFKLPFGHHQKVDFDIPDKNLTYYVERKKLPPVSDVCDSVVEAVNKPIGMPPLSKLAKRGDKVVVLVDDLTRPTPQNEVLPPVLEELCAGGLSADDVQIMIALGTHRAMSDAEIVDHLGPEVAERFEVTNSDYKDEKRLVNLGMTQLGIPALVNKAVVDADFVIGVGNIVPHNAAGWGGGGKIILPGVCGEDSVGMLHIAAGKVVPIGKLVATLDNSMRRDINIIAAKAGLKAIVNTVLNNEDRVVRVLAGDPEQAFREGVATARQVYCKNVPELADIVVFSTYPADIDYWQAMKALDFAHVGVKKGGTIVLITPCTERISPTHPSFRTRATEGYSSLLEAVNKKEFDDPPAAGALLMHSQILERANIICYSTGLTEEDEKALGFEHASSVDEAIKMAFKKHGEHARIGVMECGEVVPVAPRSDIWDS